MRAKIIPKISPLETAYTVLCAVYIKMKFFKIMKLKIALKKIVLKV